MAPEKKKTKLHNRKTPNRNCKNKKLEEETEPSAHLVGFARGLEPKKILGATNTQGEVKYLIKWKGTKNNDLVTAEEVKQRCPQLLISFFEQRIQWLDDIDTSGVDTAGGVTAAQPQPEPKSEVGSGIRDAASS